MGTVLHGLPLAAETKPDVGPSMNWAYCFLGFSSGPRICAFATLAILGSSHIHKRQKLATDPQPKVVGSQDSGTQKPQCEAPVGPCQMCMPLPYPTAHHPVMLKTPSHFLKPGAGINKSSRLRTEHFHPSKLGKVP